MMLFWDKFRFGIGGVGRAGLLVVWMRPMTFWFEAAPISWFFEIDFSWSHPLERLRALSAEGGAPAPACSKYDGDGRVP